MKYFFRLINKLLYFFSKYTTYSYAIIILGAATSAFIAIFFLYSIIQYISFSDFKKFYLILNSSIAFMFIVHSIQAGVFSRLGIPGFLKTQKILNSNIITRKNKITFSHQLKSQEKLNTLNALNFLPLQVSIIAGFEILFIGMLLVSISIHQNLASRYFLLIISGCIICLIIVSGFNLLFGELLTAPVRKSLRKNLSKSKILNNEKYYSSITFKIIFIVLIFLSGIYIVFIVTYYNKDNIASILQFALIIIFSGVSISVLAIKIIGLEIRDLLSNLKSIKSGNVSKRFSGSFDKEFGVISNDLTETSTTLKSYRNHLEHLVNKRTAQLQKANSTLKRKDSDIMKELFFAAEIQRGIMPEDFHTWESFIFESLFLPMRQVSGDYFDIIVDNDNLHILMADVSGHGIPAALITMITKLAFQEAVKLQTHPPKIMELLNKIIYQHIKTQDYVTAFYLNLHASGKFQYANAGLPYPIIIRKNNEIEMLKADGLILGATEADHSMFDFGTNQLYNGDCLFLHTDGLAEQLNDNNIQFGSENLKNLFKDSASNSLEKMHQKVLEKITLFRESHEIEDDMTLLAIRNNT